jgi:hypothetical protein
MQTMFLFESLTLFFILVYRRCYIRFIRKVNDKKGTEGQEETRKAFDFMLNYVGKLFPISFVFQFSLNYRITYLEDDDINSPKVVLLKTWFLMEFIKYKIIHMLSPYKLFAYICVFKLVLLCVFKLQAQKLCAYICMYLCINIY